MRPGITRSQPAAILRLDSRLKPRLRAEHAEQVPDPTGYGSQAQTEVPRDRFVFETRSEQREDLSGVGWQVVDRGAGGDQVTGRRPQVLEQERQRVEQRGRMDDGGR